MSNYSIRLNDTTNGNIVFEGYFVVNSSNIVVEMYETINGVTSTNNIVVLDRVPIEPYSENNYLGFQIYDGDNDYAYLPSWNKFDNYGVVINSASKYPETTTMIYLISENLGDETSSNPGLFVYNDNSSIYYIRLPVSYTITPITTVDGDLPIFCYAKGSLILTNYGYVPIENIKVGDIIVTKGEIYNNEFIKNEEFETKPVVWTSKFSVNHLNSNSRPICIQKNALGNCPFEDLYVSPGHRIILDNKMMLVKDMINGTTIYQDMNCTEVEYYHLEFDKHRAIVANGVLTESYLDVDNIRDIFE
jgi:hypothetical protein